MALRYRRATDKPRRSFTRVDRRKQLLAARIDEAETQGQRLGAYVDYLRSVMHDAPANEQQQAYSEVIALIASICRQQEQQQTRMRRTAA